MRIQERSKHELKISLYMNKWDISWKLNFVFFDKKNDKKYRWNNVHFPNFEHSLALFLSRDCATETTRWRYRVSSVIISKAKFALKILWTFKVQKEKEEKMELIVHQPGKTKLVIFGRKWPKSSQKLYFTVSRIVFWIPYWDSAQNMDGKITGRKSPDEKPRFGVILGQSGQTIFYDKPSEKLLCLTKGQAKVKMVCWAIEMILNGKWQIQIKGSDSISA